MSYDPIDHAEYLVENEGSCNGPDSYGPDRCRNCTIMEYFGMDWEDCDSDTAYECANDYLDEVARIGRCKSFW